MKRIKNNDYLNKKIPDYWIEISYDKQILLDICKREWKSDSYKD